jgi:hypothetical protein
MAGLNQSSGLFQNPMIELPDCEHVPLPRKGDIPVPWPEYP